MSAPERPWMCSCGYCMDHAAAADGGDAVPATGDLTMCLNCGKIHERTAAQSWRVMSEAEILGLPLDVQFDLAQMRAARRRVIDEDLSKRDGRA